MTNKINPNSSVFDIYFLSADPRKKLKAYIIVPDCQIQKRYYWCYMYINGRHFMYIKQRILLPFLILFYYKNILIFCEGELDAF